MPLDYQRGSFKPSGESTLGFWIGLGIGMAMSALFWFVIAAHLNNWFLNGFLTLIVTKLVLSGVAFAMGQRLMGAGIVVSMPVAVLAWVAWCFGMFR